MHTHAHTAQCTCLSVDGMCGQNRHSRIINFNVVPLSIQRTTLHSFIWMDNICIKCIPLHWSFSSVSIQRPCCGTAVNHTHCMVRLFIVIYNGQIRQHTLYYFTSIRYAYSLQTKSLIIFMKRSFDDDNTHTFIFSRSWSVCFTCLCVRIFFHMFHARLHYLMMWIILQFNSSSSILLSV